MVYCLRVMESLGNPACIGRQAIQEQRDCMWECV